jgi:hypothetical protein
MIFCYIFNPVCWGLNTNNYDGGALRAAFAVCCLFLFT